MPSRNLRQKPELLSPVGDWDGLTAAVTNGADAVFLGTREFNARLKARNFSPDDLRNVLRYCHSEGVRVYLTMNIMVRNREVRRFFDVLAQAYLAGIDGVIIQEFSFLDIIKRNYPGLAVFISTQAAIGNPGSASLLKSADRIILPRELPLEDVKQLIATGVNVEVFVHGALCFGYSGLCLFSSFVSSRSGNRGTCAQLCRQKYNGSYPLSTKELCLVNRIPELIRAGISGFKIEGRMRSPLYIAVATRLYRKAIDSFLAGKFAVPAKEKSEIEVVFNREFTEGFTFGENNLTSPEKPMNRGAFLGVVADGSIALQRHVAAGDGVGIWQDGNTSGAVISKIMVAGNKVTAASAGETADISITAADGAKVYLTSSPRISIKPDFTITRQRIPPPVRKPVRFALPVIPLRKDPLTKLLVKAYSVAEAEESLRAGAAFTFYNIFSPDFPENPKSPGFGAYLPRIMNDAQLSRALDLLAQKRPAAVLSGNLGFLPYRRDFSVSVYLDYTLNTWNDLDSQFFNNYGAIPCISPELSLSDLAELRNRDVVVFCHGDLVLVNTMIPIEIDTLTNDKQARFRVRKEDGYWEILNSRPFGVFNDIRKFHDIGFNKFLIDKESEAPHLVEMYRKMLAHETADRRMRTGYTSGHLYRPLP